MAEMSLKSVGLSSLMQRRIPELSSWKMPLVSPEASSSKVLASLRGIRCRSREIPRFCWMVLVALSKMVRLESPRKSIFNSPRRAIFSMWYWVMTACPFPLPTVCSGTYLVNGSCDMTTPAAWVLAWRILPSSFLDESIKFCTASS